jgi:hypothetical protein
MVYNPVRVPEAQPFGSAMSGQIGASVAVGSKQTRKPNTEALINNESTDDFLLITS